MKINWFKINATVFKNHIHKIIKFYSDYRFSKFILYLKQGWMCKDCNKGLYDCKCNECNNCAQNYCVCDIDFDLFIFTINILSKENIKDLTKLFISSDYTNKTREFIEKLKLYEN